MRKTLSLLALLGTCFFTNAQNQTQVVRGVIIDEDSKQPLIGANVIVQNSEPLKGAATDVNGLFRIEEIPFGRITLAVSYFGYEPRVLPNVQVNAGKETVLQIELAETILKLDEVIIEATQKGEVLNEMALISAREFSVEETKRYAGSINDPARMVSAFAGVTSNPEGNNDIVVRGNSPKGILWRLEGIEIPNPNHFSDEGSTGGPISALNSDMLANSDFFSGAFAPEYGNAFSGVFDMKLRTGNDEKREYAFGIGALGLDATLEGPISKKGKGSYLANYRYSSLALLDQLKIVDFDGVPKYTDAAFKVHLPTEKLGTFSLFGLGGMSGIDESYEDSTDYLIERGKYRSHMGVVGLNNRLWIGKNSFINSAIVLSTNGSKYNGTMELYPDSTDGSPIAIEDAFAMAVDTIINTENSIMEKSSIQFAVTLNNKINARNRIKSGIIYRKSQFNFRVEDYEDTGVEVDLNTQGNTDRLQAFSSWKHKITDQISIVGGLHLMKFGLADEWSLEPRIAGKWQLNETQAINAGIGILSKHESLTNYFVRGEDGERLNGQIGLLKTRHYVMGYQRRLRPNLMLKLDAYYQDLYNIPIHDETGSTYSILNDDDWFRKMKLVNEGTGKNYGLEFTLERYFYNSFYFLFTGSIYDSKYTAKDGNEYNTKYNGNFATNFLIGKEFTLGQGKKTRTLSINTKIFYAGPRRFTPVDRELLAQDIYALNQQQTFGAKGDPIFQINYALSLKRNVNKTTREVMIDILNITNNEARLYEYISNGKIQYGTQLKIIPNLVYRIYF